MQSSGWTRHPRMGTTLAWVVGLPTAATAAAILALAAASYHAEEMLTQALLWSRHLVALHELAVAAHDYVDGVETRLGYSSAEPLVPAPTAGDAAQRVLDAARSSRALADGFEPQEVETEEALERAAARLVELGRAALREETLDALGALVACYRGEVAPRIAARIADEERGARATFRRARSGSAILLGAAAALGLALVAAAAWRSWRLARHLAVSLDRLGAGARRLSEGDLDHRLGVTSDDELGEVAAAFDRMAEALRANTVTRQQLAREVAERTAALERSRGELEGNLDKLRSAQDQLVATERMAAIGALAAGVAHDLNSPLAFILSNVGYAIDVLGDPARTPADEADALAALREAFGGAERVRDIVRDLGGNVLADAPCGAPKAPRGVPETGT